MYADPGIEDLRRRERLAYKEIEIDRQKKAESVKSKKKKRRRRKKRKKKQRPASSPNAADFYLDDIDPEVGKLLEEVKDISSRISVSAAPGSTRDTVREKKRKALEHGKDRNESEGVDTEREHFADGIGWRAEAARLQAEREREKQRAEHQRRQQKEIAENLAVLFNIGNSETQTGKLYEQSLIVLAEKCSDPTLSQRGVERAVTKWMVTQLPILNLLQRRSEAYAATVLQRSWRNYVRRVGET